MNTCAECRFWDRESFGEKKQCTFFSDEDDGIGHSAKTTFRERASVHAIESGGAILMTRSDFGCVQFESKPAAVPTTRDEIIRDALTEAKGWIDPDDVRLVNSDEARGRCEDRPRHHVTEVNRRTAFYCDIEVSNELLADEAALERFMVSHYGDVVRRHGGEYPVLQRHVAIATVVNGKILRLFGRGLFSTHRQRNSDTSR